MPYVAIMEAHVSVATTSCQALQVEIDNGAATPGGATR